MHPHNLMYDELKKMWDIIDGDITQKSSHHDDSGNASIQLMRVAGLLKSKQSANLIRLLFYIARNNIRYLNGVEDELVCNALENIPNYPGYPNYSKGISSYDDFICAEAYQEFFARFRNDMSKPCDLPSLTSAHGTTFFSSLPRIEMKPRYNEDNEIALKKTLLSDFIWGVGCSLIVGVISCLLDELTIKTEAEISVFMLGFAMSVAIYLLHNTSKSQDPKDGRFISLISYCTSSKMRFSDL